MDTKERKSAWHAANYSKNREDLLEKNRLRLVAKRDQYNAARRAKRLANPDPFRVRERARVRNPVQVAERNRIYNAANRAAIRTKHQEWRARNYERDIEKNKEKRKATREQRKAYVAAWRAANPNWARERYATDPTFNLTCRLRARLAKVLRSKGLRKTDGAMRLVGCGLHELMAHLEQQFLPGMTWQNRSEWHVDHIRQCATFDLAQADEQAACFHFTNLRPLWGPANLARPRPRLRPEPAAPNYQIGA